MSGSNLLSVTVNYVVTRVTPTAIVSPNHSFPPSLHSPLVGALNTGLSDLTNKQTHRMVLGT